VNWGNFDYITEQLKSGTRNVAVPSEISSAPAPTMTLCSWGNKLTREELARVSTPAGTATHKPIAHIGVVEKLSSQLSPDLRSAGRIRRVMRWNARVRCDGLEFRL
jgi:hypothetical protein